MNPTLRALIRKEMTELLRDRRVLIMGLVVPILAFPLIMALTNTAEERKEQNLAEEKMPIALVGELPGLIAAIEDDGRFDLVTSIEPDSLRSAVERSRVEVAIDAREGWYEPNDSERPTVIVYTHRSRETSREGNSRVRELLEQLREAEVQRRFVERGGSGTLAEIAPDTSRDIAYESEAAGASAGRMVVYILIWTLFSGGAAFATDLVAGEKERGTLETLFLLPVDRSMVAKAKLFVATLGTVMTGLLNMASILFTVQMGWFSAGGEATGLAISSILQTAVLVVPLAVLLASFLLGISAYSRSLKEAQYYILPAMFVMFIPAVLSTSQAVELNALIAMIPIANVAFAMRDAFLGQLSPIMLITVAAATLGWAVLVLRGVSAMLADEATVLGFDPEPIFAKTRGGRTRALHLAMAFVLLAYFFVANWLQTRHGFTGLLLSLAVLLPILTVGVAWFARNDVALGDLIPLRFGAPQVWLAAPLLAVGVLWPIAGGLTHLQSQFLPMPEGDMAALERILGGRSTLELFSVGALAPGIFEEVLFRGVCLALLLRVSSVRTAIFMSSLYFALMHMSIFRIAPTFLLGCLMAVMVWRSRSILPAMLFHVLYNGSLLVGGTMYGEGRLDVPVEGPVVWAVSAALLIAGGWLLASAKPRVSTG